jgi:hypothetical protein
MFDNSSSSELNFCNYYGAAFDGLVIDRSSDSKMLQNLHHTQSLIQKRNRPDLPSAYQFLVPSTLRYKMHEHTFYIYDYFRSAPLSYLL